MSMESRWEAKLGALRAAAGKHQARAEQLLRALQSAEDHDAISDVDHIDLVCWITDTLTRSTNA